MTKQGRDAARGADTGSAPVSLEKRYYRIGEVARITGLEPHVLRYWESEFRWLSPPKSRSKQRRYRRRDIEVLLLIKRLLYQERYTIEGARRRLRELGVTRALDSGRQLHLAMEGDAHAQLRRIRDELRAIRALL